MTQAGGGDRPGDPAGLAKLRVIAEAVDARIPARYRREAFRALARRVVSGPDPVQNHVVSAEHELSRGEASAASGSPEPAAGVRMGLAAFAQLLTSPGRVLLKALAALQAAADQTDLEWMTPAEIEHLLREQGGTAGIYRTNVSNALRASRGLVDRRRRQRGFEYRITTLGRQTLASELRRLHR